MWGFARVHGGKGQRGVSDVDADCACRWTGPFTTQTSSATTLRQFASVAHLHTHTHTHTLLPWAQLRRLLGGVCAIVSWPLLCVGLCLPLSACTCYRLAAVLFPGYPEMPLKPTRMCHPLRSLPLWRPPCPRTWPHAIMHHQALLAPLPLAPSPPTTGLRRPRRMSRPRARGEGAGRGHVPRKRYSMAQRDDARNATTRKSKSGGCRGCRIAQNVNEKHWQISRFTPFAYTCCVVWDGVCMPRPHAWIVSVGMTAARGRRTRGTGKEQRCA
jgi:hypothetical protein